MTMDLWLIHCSLISITSKWKGKAFPVDNSAEKGTYLQEQIVPPSGDDTGI